MNLKNTKHMKYFSGWINKFNIGDMEIEYSIGFARVNFTQHRKLLLNWNINLRTRVMSLNCLIISNSTVWPISSLVLDMFKLYPLIQNINNVYIVNIWSKNTLHIYLLIVLRLAYWHVNGVHVEGQTHFNSIDSWNQLQ